MAPPLMKMLSGRPQVASGGGLASYLTSGRPQLSGPRAGGALAGYVSGAHLQQLTVNPKGSLAAYLKRGPRRKHRPYDPNQPRQPRGRPEGGQWMEYPPGQRPYGVGAFTLTPDMEDELDGFDFAPFEKRLGTAGLAALGFILRELIDALQAFLAQSESARILRMQRLRAAQTRFRFKAVKSPSARRIR